MADMSHFSSFSSQLSAWLLLHSNQLKKIADLSQIHKRAISINGNLIVPTCIYHSEYTFLSERYLLKKKENMISTHLHPTGPHFTHTKTLCRCFEASGSKCKSDNSAPGEKRHCCTVYSAQNELWKTFWAASAWGWCPKSTKHWRSPAKPCT